MSEEAQEILRMAGFAAWHRPFPVKKDAEGRYHFVTETELEVEMGTTDDRNDPALKNIGPDGMQEKYLVLSDEERAKGFVRPLRKTYKHLKCGAVTTMGLAIAETYARDPHFYGGTYCSHCGAHFPVGSKGEFVWDRTDERVGT